METYEITGKIVEAWVAGKMHLNANDVAEAYKTIFQAVSQPKTQN